MSEETNETTAPAPKPATAPPTPAEATGQVEPEASDFDVDEEMGSVSTRVGTVGWPEDAENEQGIGPDGLKVEDED